MIHPLPGKWLGIRLRQSNSKAFGSIISTQRETYPSQLIYVVDGSDSGYQEGDLLLVRSHIGEQVGQFTLLLNKNILAKLVDYSDDIIELIEEAKGEATKELYYA